MNTLDGVNMKNDVYSCIRALLQGVEDQGVTILQQNSKNSRSSREASAENLQNMKV